MGKIFITGLGQRSHLGANVDEALLNLKNPTQDSILKLSPLHLESESIPDVSVDIDDVEKNNKDGKPLGRANRLLIAIVREALEQAKLTPDELSTARVGVIVGTTSACTVANPEFSMKIHHGEAGDIEAVHHFYYANPAQSLSHFFDLSGPVMAINNACTSGTDAIGVARDWIRADLCDIVIAGGVDIILENMYLGFKSLKLFDEEYCKPFSQNRGGLILGEAAGMVIIESEKQAHKRDVKPLASIKGYGQGSDCYHPTTPDPAAYGLELSLNAALKDAKISLEQIDLVNAHGTGTPNNDLIEGQFLKKTFPSTPVFATKAYTGHTLGAAGALEAVWGCLCFNHYFIPKTLGFEILDPEIKLTPTTKVMPYEGNYFLSTSLGFGGANSTLILERFQSPEDQS